MGRGRNDQLSLQRRSLTSLFRKQDLTNLIDDRFDIRGIPVAEEDNDRPVVRRGITPELAGKAVDPACMSLREMPVPVSQSPAITIIIRTLRQTHMRGKHQVQQLLRDQSLGVEG